MGKCKISVIGAIVLLFSSVVSVSAQTSFTVSGTVRDSGGDVLPGVAVVCKENNKSVSTDLNGHYQIAAASASSILEFSFIGMKDKAVPVNKRQILDVVMEDDATLLEAAVSVGYGVIQKRDDFTGSAVQVTKEQIALRPADRLDNLLVGMVPGMNVIEDSNSGRPSVKIRIRGDGSLSASNEPLWIIDGVPIFQGTRTNSVTGTSATVSPLSYMNPDDIESITVLKDASTTTLYGADGSNGVILVTTRNAKSGDVRYNASVRYGLSNVDRSTLLKRANGRQYLALAKEAWVNSGRSLETFPYQDNQYQTFSTEDFDWYGAYMGTGQTLQANFSASGGSEKMKYVLSGGYFDSSSYMKGNDKKRYSISSKTDVNFTRTLSAQVKLTADYNIDDLFSPYSTYDSYLPHFLGIQRGRLVPLLQLL